MKPTCAGWWLGLVFCGVPGAVFAESEDPGMAVTVVSPMEKVFRDSVPASVDAPVVKFECAANEFESAQFVLRSNREVEAVTVELSDLVAEASGGRIAASQLQWHFVGYVPVTRNTTESQCGAHRDVPKGELLRAAPFDCPDPLLEDRSISLAANSAQPVWMTLRTLKGTAAGLYRGVVTIRYSGGQRTLPVEARVFPFQLQDERHLWLTNWFEIGHIARAHQVRVFTEEFWTILGRYARNLAEHHQNVIYTPWDLIRVFQEKDGSLTFDYANFDRFVEVFMAAGTAERIEIQHVAGHGPEGRAGKIIPLYKVDPVNRESGKRVSLPGDEGMLALLRDLRRHLVEKDWLERTILHVSDEPSFHNAAQWKETARRVREAIPGVKTIDAIEATGFEDSMDIMVPQTVNLQTWFADFKKAQEGGRELWFYTCCSPWGHYANRFLDYHLSKTRILHWMNYFTGTEGFLHWGLTFDWDDPFGPAPTYPPGDSHIIYPGAEGPMSSMRWEMLREGMEDYEYLWLLGQKTQGLMSEMGVSSDRFPSQGRSQELAGKLIRSLVDYESDPAAIETVRRLLAAEIVAIDQEPRMLLAANPAEGELLSVGPAMVKVHGFVGPGTQVRINGAAAEVDPSSGEFVQKVRLSWSVPTLTVEAVRGTARKVVVREYRID